jgi:hypothetical protein
VPETCASFNAHYNATYFAAFGITISLSFIPLSFFFICLFCFVLFCFVLFCFVLFCFVLFCFVLCCVVLFYVVLFCVVFDERRYYHATAPVQLQRSARKSSPLLRPRLTRFFIYFYFVLFFVFLFFCFYLSYFVLVYFKFKKEKTYPAPRIHGIAKN